MAQSIGFSLEAISKIKGEAHATIRNHAAEIVSLSSAIGDVDAALVASSERNLDEWQSLVSAARRLASLLDGTAVSP